MVLLEVAYTYNGKERSNVHDILQANQVDTEIFCEGNLNHPADYDCMTYSNEDEFNKIE